MKDEEPERRSLEGDLWLTATNKLVTDLLYNHSQSREYPPLLSERQEAFTEDWGDWEDEPSPPDSDHRGIHGIPVPFPQIPVILFQFEPAWQEQLALQIAGIEHIVVNVSFASTEAGGPLPCLYDFSVKEYPVIVGRRTKRAATSSLRNSILVYLTERRNLDLDRGLSDAMKPLSRVYEILIHDTISSLLDILHYQDIQSWRQIYRRQYQSAGGGRWANVQTWTFRNWSQFQLTPLQRDISVSQAIERARSAFDILEKQLLANNNPSSYLLGLDEPSLVDILLWDCLLKAFNSVHLIPVLSEFPALCDYAQFIWNIYFPGSAKAKSWQQWNYQENAYNPFCELPVMSCGMDSSCKHSVALMEQLSPQIQSFHERLVEGRELRTSQEQHLPKPHRPFQVWHHWRMDADLFPLTAGHKKKVYTEDSTKLHEYKRNDDLWVATAVISILVSMIVFASRPT